MIYHLAMLAIGVVATGILLGIIALIVRFILRLFK